VNGEGPRPTPELFLEAYQNPHPALSHNKMCERVIAGAALPQLCAGEGDPGAAHKIELKGGMGCINIGGADSTSRARTSPRAVTGFAASHSSLYISIQKFRHPERRLPE